MILQNSEWAPWLKELLADPLWGYVRGVNLILWLIAITTMYLVGLVFFKRAKATDLDSQKSLFRSFGLLFMIMGLTRISFIVGYFIEPWYNFLLALGYCFGALAMLPLVFTLEKYLIKQTKRFFSLVGVILTIVGFAFLYVTLENPRLSELSRTLQNIGMPVLASAFLILYGWVIKNSAGDIRKKALMTLIGMFIFVVGILLDSETLVEQIPATMHIAPIVFTLGIIIVSKNQKIE
jgi:hypothetical protein